MTQSPLLGCCELAVAHSWALAPFSRTSHLAQNSTQVDLPANHVQTAACSQPLHHAIHVQVTIISHLEFRSSPELISFARYILL